MISLVSASDLRNRRGRQVVRIRRLRIVLERFMVRDVIDSGRSSRDIVMSSGTNRLPAGDGTRFKSTLEPTPSQALRIEQVSYVLAVHRDQRLSCDGAIVERKRRPRIANNRSRRYVAGSTAASNARPVSLSRDKVQSAGRRRTKRS